MRVDTANQRLLALDGLRGFAIILVFLSHLGIPASESHSFIYQLLFVGGGVGVGFLFVLSGFLMAFLYPQPGTMYFLQKRYSRIFPLLLTITLALFVFTLIPTTLFSQALLLLCLAITVHIVWMYAIKPATISFRRTLLQSFLILQIAVGLAYFLISQNIITSDFSKMPSIFYSLSTMLVNSTLTFFVGTSIPVLSDVAWSLAAEILFYILYPIVCVPIIAHLSAKSRWIKIIFLACLIPLFFGFARLLERVPNFSSIHPDYFYHFVGGMSFGYLYRKYRTSIPSIYKSAKKWISIGSIPLSIGVFIIAHMSTPLFNGMLDQIILTALYTSIVAVLLLPETRLAQIFRSKLLIFIGTISYSIYLSHPWIIHATRKVFGQPTTMAQQVSFITLSIVFCILVGSIFYLSLERPYFVNKNAREKNRAFISYKPNNKALLIYVGICILYLTTAFTAYRIALPYNHLRDSYYRKIATSSNNNKVDAVILENEKRVVATETTKTFIMFLPFFFVTCYLIYEGRVLSLRRIKLAFKNRSWA